MIFCFVLPAEYSIVSQNKNMRSSTAIRSERSIRSVSLFVVLLERLEGWMTLQLSMEKARIRLKAEREAQHNYARGFLQHSRRGDKHKKPMFVHKQQYYNNNRVDRPTHAQCNNKCSKRNY